MHQQQMQSLFDTQRSGEKFATPSQQQEINRKQQEINGAKSPPPLPKKQFYAHRNGYMRDETDIVSEMNQMYMHSPFVQRKCEPPDSNYGSSPKMEAIYNNIGML